MKGKKIFIFANGSVRKVPRCNVHLCEKDNEEIEIKEEEKQKGGSVKFDYQDFGGNITTEDVEKKVRRRICSIMDVERRELERDKISTFWMKLENTECFDDFTIYTVEVPVKEHKRPEVIEAKDKEI